MSMYYRDSIYLRYEGTSTILVVSAINASSVGSYSSRVVPKYKRDKPSARVLSFLGT